MKKRLTALVAITLLTSTTLVSCGEGYDYKDGVMLTINGKEYTTDELFSQYGLNTSAGQQAYYKAVNNVLIEANIAKDSSMDSEVNSDIEAYKKAAKDSASSNGTTEAEELEKKLKADKFDSLEELENSYYLTKKTTKANNQYYTDNRYNTIFTSEYINNLFPYHVRHILVKVDASTKLDNKISASNAKNLANVVTRLASGNETFGITAQATSEDTSSAEKFGELQLPMSKTTSYVNEFKLNLYTYDAYFNSKISDKNKVIDNVLAPSSLETYSGNNLRSEYEKLAKDSVFGIPYSSVIALNEYADTTKDSSGVNVTSNNAESYYPRNVIFNNYFNNHSISYIYLDEPSDSLNDLYGTGFKDKYQTYYDQVKDSSRWSVESTLNGKLKTYSEASGTNHRTQKTAITSEVKVLHDENNYPILVTRAGTGSTSTDSTESSGYQGIHFISVIKNPFETSSEDLLNYYTLETPDVEDSSWQPKQNFLGYNYSNKDSDYTTKKNNFKTEIKNYVDTNSFRMFNENLDTAAKGEGSNKIKVVVSDEIKASINSYIDSTNASNEMTRNETWENSWTTFYEYLKEFDSTYQSNILPLSAIAAFNSGTDKVNEYELARAK